MKLNIDIAMAIFACLLLFIILRNGRVRRCLIGSFVFTFYSGH